MKKGMQFHNFKISLINQIKKIAVPDKDVYLHLHCIAPKDFTSDEINAIDCGYVFSIIGGGIFYCEIHEKTVKFIREANLEELYLKYTTHPYYFNILDLRLYDLFSKEKNHE